MARKQRTGVVVSDHMNKTVVVRVERTVRHPRYKKVLRRRKQFKAHDETDVCRLGDTVLIEECRPLSKHKQWRVVQILKRHEVAEIQPREIEAPPIEEATPESEATTSAAAAETATEPSAAEAADESVAAPTAAAEPATPDAAPESEPVPTEETGE